MRTFVKVLKVFERYRFHGIEPANVAILVRAPCTGADNVLLAVEDQECDDGYQPEETCCLEEQSPQPASFVRYTRVLIEFHLLFFVFIAAIAASLEGAQASRFLDVLSL